VAVRAALESAVQVGRGDECNRQAEMANPTKCRDSLQPIAPRGARMDTQFGLTGVFSRVLTVDVSTPLTRLMTQECDAAECAAVDPSLTLITLGFKGKNYPYWGRHVDN
jgi:hypothetical protein